MVAARPEPGLVRLSTSGRRGARRASSGQQHDPHVRVAARLGPKPLWRAGGLVSGPCCGASIGRWETRRADSSNVGKLDVMSIM